jgi:hypothetical protein
MSRSDKRVPVFGEKAGAKGDRISPWDMRGRNKKPPAEEKPPMYGGVK